mgnify:CR=1 FL=1
MLALWLASMYIEGVVLTGGYWEIALAGIVFSLVNFILKPILKLALGPLILLTFGIAAILINMGILKLTDTLLPQLDIMTLGALVLATLLMSAVNIVLHLVFRR